MTRYVEFNNVIIVGKQAEEVANIGATRMDWCVIRGTIIDHTTHQPVGGALVRATRRNANAQVLLGTTVSRTDGSYTLSLPRTELLAEDEVIIHAERRSG